MPDISSIGHGSIGPINRAADRSGRLTSTPTADHGATRGDKVELSPHARLMDQIRQLPEVRKDLIDRIKHEIEAGTYDTPEKLDAAVAELLIDLE